MSPPRARRGPPRRARPGPRRAALHVGRQWAPGPTWRPEFSGWGWSTSTRGSGPGPRGRMTGPTAGRGTRERAHRSLSGSRLYFLSLLPFIFIIFFLCFPTPPACARGDRSGRARLRCERAGAAKPPSAVDTWGCCGPRRAAARAAWEQGQPGSRVGNGVCGAGPGHVRAWGDFFFYAPVVWNAGTS